MKRVHMPQITRVVMPLKRALLRRLRQMFPDGASAGARHALLRRAPGLLLLGSALVGLSAIFLVPRGGHTAFAAPAPYAAGESSPVLLKVNGNIEIPGDSSLRQKLTIRAVEVKDVGRTLEFPAVVEADPALTAKVLPPLSGRIVDLRVALGDHVESGQVVAVMNSADLAQAYDDFEKAQSALTLSQRALDRQRSLTEIRAGAAKDMEAALDTYTQAQAEFRRTSERLNQIGAPTNARGSKGRLLTITAPVSGTVTDLSASRGTYFNDPTQALMTVSQLDRVWVTASVAEKDISFVSKGQAAEVTLLAYPGEVLKGNVLFTSDILDPDTRRMKVRIEFPNPNTRLKPGMFGTVTFLAPPQAVATIPSTALVLKDDVDCVFVETRPWTFEVRPVETQVGLSDQVIVTHGLAAGDRVVVKGGVLLND